MFSAGERYFAQTKIGESTWWSWAITFWFTIIGAAITQNVIAGPIPEIVKDSHPELYDAFRQASNAMLADPELGVKIAIFGIGIIFSIVLTVIFWGINRATSETTRTVFGWATGIFAVLTFALVIPILPLLSDPEFNNVFLQMVGASPWAYALLLLTFPAMLIGLYLCQKFIHKRTILSLHTAASKINWTRILFAIIVTWAVYGVLTATMHFSGFSEVQYSFDSKRFLIFALISLLLIPLQSATEEIIFRGYLNQAFGHFIQNKWVVFTITSLMFTAMHLSNPESVSGAEGGAMEHIMVMSGYFFFAFILSVLVYAEGGLESAIGFHAANNMFAAIFVNYEGSVLPTPSLFLSGAPEGTDSLWSLLLLGLVAIILIKTRKQSVEA